MEKSLGHHLRELPGPLLLTGHTGFKGTWMTLLLEHLNVPVIGYSLAAEKDSLYDRAKRAGCIPEAVADIKEYEVLEKFIDFHKPSTIIHMAAQPLVLKSYESPRETFDVNVMGTVNVLDIAFKKDFVKAIIIVTTDKVYKNNNSGSAFVESDSLEGKDPYSASKVGTEAAVSAWQQIALTLGGPNIAVARAGNVIGGGDWAKDRLLPDIMRGFFNNEVVSIRNSGSTRPWQHVLDPLIGYLMLLEKNISESEVRKINFGPTSKSLSVRELLEILKKFSDIRTKESEIDTEKNNKESINLDLDSTLAFEKLGWKAKWSQEKSIISTFNWWNDYFKSTDPVKLCRRDIIEILEEKIES